VNDKIFAMACCTVIVLGMLALSYAKPIDGEMAETARLVIGPIMGAAFGYTLRAAKKTPPENQHQPDQHSEGREPEIEIIRKFTVK